MKRELLCQVALSLSLIIGAGVASAQDAQTKVRLKIGHYESKAQKAYESKEYPTAIENYNRLLTLAPFSPGTLYNLACCHALNGDKDAALDALSKSVELGWDDPVWMSEKDDDLKSLRGDKRFEDICEAAKAISGESVYVYAPPTLKPDSPAPVMVVLHGFGGNARQFASYFKKVADENNMLVIAPRGSAHLGQLAYGWNNPGSPRDIDFSKVANQISEAIDQVAQTHKLDRERIVVAGFSQGGAVALHLMASNPSKYAGVFAVAAAAGMISDEKWKKVESDPAPAVYLLAGQSDPAHAQVDHARHMIADAGYRVNFVEPEGVAHEMPANYEKHIKAALKFIFKP